MRTSPSTPATKAGESIAANDLDIDVGGHAVDVDGAPPPVYDKTPSPGTWRDG